MSNFWSIAILSHIFENMKIRDLEKIGKKLEKAKPRILLPVPKIGI